MELITLQQFADTREYVKDFKFTDNVSYTYCNRDYCIDVHKDEANNNIYEVLLDDSYRFTSLREAEKFLYDHLIQKAIKTHQDRELDFKVETPNGIHSWVQTFFNISEMMGYVIERKSDDGVVLFEGVEELDAICSYDKMKIAVEEANKFENRFPSKHWENDDNELTFVEEIDALFGERFKPKYECKIDTVEFYEIAEAIGMKRCEDNEFVERLDGADGRHSFALDIALEFRERYKNYEWGCSSEESSLYDKIDEFLEEKTKPKKKFLVERKRLITEEVVVEAKNQEEATEIAMANENDLDFDLVDASRSEICTKRELP